MTADVADAEGLHQLKLSGTKFRKMLRAGEDIPEWCASHTSRYFSETGLMTRLITMHLWLQVCLQVRRGCSPEGDYCLIHGVLLCDCCTALSGCPNMDCPSLEASRTPSLNIFLPDQDAVRVYFCAAAFCSGIHVMAMHMCFARCYSTAWLPSMPCSNTCIDDAHVRTGASYPQYSP